MPRSAGGRSSMIQGRTVMARRDRRPHGGGVTGQGDAGP
ncbi:Hypothetical protein A7982_05289 [Minicystis rosea]|nr:Hypothetical protein A7982_05289 [Minicystis rosea]